jgi:hypothetical protein
MHTCCDRYLHRANIDTLCHRSSLQCHRLSYRWHSLLCVDVARYQGDIDWQTVSKEKILIVYIKATEGKTHRLLR